MLTLKTLIGAGLLGLGLIPAALIVHRATDTFPLLGVVAFLAAIAGDVGILLVYAQLVR